MSTEGLTLPASGEKLPPPVTRGIPRGAQRVVILSALLLVPGFAAAWLMIGPATALGLGTLYIGYFDSSAAARIIGVPEGISLYAILVVGHPAEDSPPRKRRPLEEIVFNERYGAA